MKEIIYLCEHVHDFTREPAVLIHHRDGNVQVSCGVNDHKNPVLRRVRLDDFAAEFPLLAKKLESLDVGHMAELSDSDWAISEHDD